MMTGGLVRGGALPESPQALSAGGSADDTGQAMSERERILRQTAEVRERAEGLLRGLLDARARTRRLTPDPMQIATGQSAIDRAIESTRRMVETLRRAFEEASTQISEEDAMLLRRDEDDRMSPTA